jgi:2-polyprenyl-3-methyl-5-hydroxy-6-metoxy-1,4-benzoquinol methylase
MKNCILCHETHNVKLLKTVDGINIFVCCNCEIGFLDKKALIEQKKLSNKVHYSITDYRKNEKQLKKRFKSLSEIILEFKNRGNLLDIGAGFGLISSIFAKKGFRINVLEPFNSPFYLKKYDKKIYKMKLEDFLRRNKNKYDLILMIDIIEHLRDPVVSLSLLKSSLEKKSIIAIQTPNYISLMARLCLNWSWWMIEDHKFFFTPKSLIKLMSESGYKVKYLKTYEDMIDFKKNLDGNFVNIESKILRKTYKAIYYLLFFPFYFIFRPLIWKLGYGGLIFAVFTNDK